jgi:cysteine-rich repeat protein
MTATHPSPRRSIQLRLCLAVLTVLAASPHPASAAPAVEDFAGCQLLYAKTADKLAAKRAKTVLKCATKLTKCEAEASLDGKDLASCNTKTVGACAKKLDKLAGKVTKSLGAIDAKGSCEPLFQSDAAATVGLGFKYLDSLCTALGNPRPIDFDTANACLADALDCHADQLVEALVPRLRSLLDSSGLAAARPGDFVCVEDPGVGALVAGDSKDLLKCQKSLTKTVSKPLLKLGKELTECRSAGLACAVAEDRLEAATDSTATCLAGEVTSSCTAAENAFVAALEAAVTKAGEGCADFPIGDLLAGLGFDATCGASTTAAELAACAADAAVVAATHLVGDVSPRACQLRRRYGLLADDALAGICVPRCGNGVLEGDESCDDGNRDAFDSCTNDCVEGPVASELFDIASLAAPAGTPDGTPGTAVAPGSTLATQFGSTTFDLNRARFVRHYAPGAGDPDAVLILVPGFAGGAHSLKGVSEHMVARAAEAGNIVLEVWAIDRRTNFLEDDAGAVLAESENDGRLALDWYFGDDLGFALDARLARRAVFHAGSDLAFLANFTYRVFALDIDAMVEEALALPSAPTVFLGGHSLGTVFTARYAASDLDAGAGVEAGHAKLGGLVLFEGGGDSLPSAAPSDAALDLVIAKADGGLFHAVASGAASCYDGTPCPGGDADCAALPLSPGALTNKCVAPVEAFTGASGSGALITPQIHASGDAASIQARHFPDSLSLPVTDFGSGSAIDNVPELSILGLLPPASAEASIGFFLDDDYSPVAAFQASVGFSTNGANSNFGDFFLPQPANLDPYRLWKHIDETMPSQALPNHGAAAAAGDINGQEKEVTAMDYILTGLRSGGTGLGDWYFASSGLSVTAGLSVGSGTFSGGLDTTALSVTRGRPDIENLTEAGGIGIPVICFGGTNGLTPTGGSFLAFASSLPTCTAASCDGSTARVVDPVDGINPTFGDVEGGFEVHLSEGYAHIDVVTAEDDPSHNNVYAPLLAFLERNTN